MKRITLVAAAAALSLSACNVGLSPAEQAKQDEWNAMSDAEQDLMCMLMSAEDARRALDMVEEMDVIGEVTGASGFSSEEERATLSVIARNC